MFLLSHDPTKSQTDQPGIKVRPPLSDARNTLNHGTDWFGSRFLE